MKGELSLTLCNAILCIFMIKKVIYINSILIQAAYNYPLNKTQVVI